MPPPETLRTRRFILRAPRAGDVPRLIVLLNDPLIARNTARIPAPYTQEDAEHFIAFAENTRAEERGARFLALEAEEIVACAGVSRNGESGEDAFELGYWVGANHRGRGVATEAARAVLDFARDALGGKIAVAGHFVDNPTSGAVLVKLGFKATGERVMQYSLGRGAEAEAIRYRMAL